MPGPPIAALPVGDPRRRVIGRAVLGTLALGVLFTCLTFAGKEMRGLETHAPWRADPYDVVTSFAIFFVPSIAVLQLVRLPFCRRDRPLLVERAAGLLRGGRLLVGVVAVSLVAQWVSVALGAERTRWGPATALLVLALAALTLLAAGAVPGLQRATASIEREPRGPRWSCDVPADAGALAELVVVRLGPVGRPIARLVRGVDARVADAVRRHPLLAAAAVALGFGTMVASAQAIEDGDVGAVSLIFLGAAACGMFAFLVVAGAYLRVLRVPQPASGARRRLTDAIVLAAASVPVALAFRSALWWAIGATDERAGPAQLGELLVLVAALTLAATYAAESVAGTHET